MTRKQLQRGVYRSTRQLGADIRAFIDKHNQDPKPFKWTKSADDMLAAVKRFCLRVDQNSCHELQIQMTRAMRENLRRRSILLPGSPGWSKKSRVRWSVIASA